MCLTSGQRTSYYRLQKPLFQVPITNPVGKDLLILNKRKERMDSLDFPIISHFHQVVIREALTFTLLPFLKLLVYNSTLEGDTSNEPNYEIKLIYYYHPKFQDKIAVQNEQVLQVIIQLLGILSGSGHEGAKHISL